MRATIALVLVAALAAQRTFVVDAANGAGTHFTDLPPALAQAQHRDVFLIRAGTYSPARTDKGVSLLGAPGVRIDAGSGIAPPLVVVNLPRGETFAARQLQLLGITATQFQAQTCDGRIHLQALVAGSLFPAPSLELLRCREVSVVGAQLSGVVRATNSVVAVTASVLTGRASITGTGASPGLMLVDATGLITDSALRGGDGFIGMGSGSLPAAAMYATRSDVTVAASAAGRSSLTGGNCVGSFCGPLFGAPACSLSDAQLRYSGAVTFATQYGGQPIALLGSSRATQVPLPALLAAGASVGGTLTVTLASAPGDPFVLVVAVPGDPVAHPAGTVFVDFSAWAVLAQSVQGGSGVTVYPVAVPAEASLRGAAFVVQAASYAAAVQTLFFTNPGFVVLD